MNLPNDPVMLLSVINTQLRDHYSSFDELVTDNELSEADMTAIIEKLEMIDYVYDSNSNQFK